MKRWTYIKLIASLILSCLLSLPLFGVAINATGEGKTLNEAKVRAGQELLTQITVTVSSKQRLVQSATSEGKEELFLEDIQLQSELELLGVQYKVVEETKKRVVVSASLSEETLPLYLEKLDWLDANIKEIENRLVDQSSIESKKIHLLKLISYYDDYEAYSMIAKSLDEKIAVPMLSRPKSGAELDYLNLLIAESDILASKLAELKQDHLPTKNEFSTLEAQSKIEMIARQLEINQNERERIEQEQAIQREQLSASIDRMIQESVERMGQLANSNNTQIVINFLGNQPLDYIRKIEETKIQYVELQNTIEKEYEILSRRINDRYKQEIRSIEEASFRIGEVVDGMPTKWAIELRNSQIAIKNSEMEYELELAWNTLWNSISTSRSALQRQILEGIRNLEENDFFVDAVEYRIESFDGLEGAWPLSIRYSILGSSFVQELYLPYSSLTGVSLPKFSTETAKELADYQTYLNNVEIYETYFKTTSLPLDIEIGYSISIFDKPSSYALIPRSIFIRRTDTGEICYSFQITNAAKSAGEYVSLPEVMLPFTYTSVYAREMQIITEKYEQQVRRESLLKERDRKLADAKTYYRSGGAFSQGFGYPIKYTIIKDGYYGPTEEEAEGGEISVAISGNWTPVNNLYIGAELGSHLAMSYKDTLPSYVSLSPFFGVVAPLKIEKLVFKPYAEFRIEISNIGFGTAIELGLLFRKIGDSMEGEFAIRYQTSGDLKGMFSYIYSVCFDF